LLADLRNVPYGSDGSTLYYSTETHCMGLLIGAALGALSTSRATTRRPAGSARRRVSPQLDAVGAAALGTVLLFTRGYHGYSHTLYRGGFLLLSALVAVVIAVATGPGSRLGTVLEAPILRWVGVRSYSIYLWHWPIAVVSRPGLDTTMPTWLDQVLRVVLTLGLAHLTYRFVEAPVRRLGFGPALRTTVRYLRRRVVPPAARPAVVALAAVPVVAVGVLLVGPHAPRSAAATAGRGGTNLSLDPRRSPPPYVGPRQTPTPGPAGLPRISGFGDSVLLDARRSLSRTFGGGTIDAVIGRQPGPILGDVRKADRDHRLNPVVVIQAGNNGLINPSDLQHTLATVSANPTVTAILVVNDHLDPFDHDWQTPNNALISRLVPQFAKARVVDWNAAANHHHDWLYPDDLHLRPAGAAGYVSLLVAAYRSTEPARAIPAG
jgi:hypothetical protein